MDYAWIVTAFQITYAFGLRRGRPAVRPHRGARRVSAVGELVECRGHGARGGEGGTRSSAWLARDWGWRKAGTSRAAVKTVAEWFPKEERALATGLFNAGSNIGAVACPLLVPWLAGRWGWQTAFLATARLDSRGWLAWGFGIVRPSNIRGCRQTESAYIRRGTHPIPRCMCRGCCC